MRYSYDYQGETHHIDLTRQPDGSLSATIGDKRYAVHVSQTPDGGWLLRIDGQRTLAYVASQGDERYIHLAGQPFTLEKADAGRRKRGAVAGGGDLTAEMPGQVMDVRVQVGDAVETGAVLVVLEAMKMEIRVTAPNAGTIQTLFVAKGDFVERGQRLIELDLD